jgi:hypothetical protein
VSAAHTVDTGRVETIGQVVIVFLVAVMAGAASFTHVHDWTMDNSPAGTPDWFGWANAVISELTPLAAGLEIRRRRRLDYPIDYPIVYPFVVLLAAAALSLAAQFAQAKPGVSGWLLAAVPALAFLALSKLVLSARPAAPAPAPVSTMDSPAPAPPVVAVSTDPVVPSAVEEARTPGLIPPLGVTRPVRHVNGTEVTAR